MFYEPCIEQNQKYHKCSLQGQFYKEKIDFETPQKHLKLRWQSTVFQVRFEGHEKSIIDKYLRD